MARSPAKRVSGTLLFVLALVLLLAFYFIVFADSEQIDSVPGTSVVSELALVFAVLFAVIAVVLLIMLLVGGRDDEPVDDDFFVPEEDEPAPREPEPEPEPVFEDTGDGLVVYDIWTLPVARRAWGMEDDARTHSFYFPLGVESGVYVNDYIPLDDDPDGERLKLRTLLAGPADFDVRSYTIPSEAAPLAPSEPEEPWEPEHEPVDEEPEPPARPPRPRRDATDSERFMDELERRFEERGQEQTQVAVTEKSAYYDFPGDVHDVIDVEGIGPVYAEKLKQRGIKTTARLCYEDAAEVAAKIDTSPKNVKSWQAMAELMKISGVGPQYAEALARAGVEGIDELKRRSASRIAQQVNAYLRGLDSNVLGHDVTEGRVAVWKRAAKNMRRVRMRIPEE